MFLSYEQARTVARDRGCDLGIAWKMDSNKWCATVIGPVADEAQTVKFDAKQRIKEDRLGKILDKISPAVV